MSLCDQSPLLAALTFDDVSVVRGGFAARGHPEETWPRVEGTVVPEPQSPSGLAIPTLTVTTLTPIEAPKHPYGC